MCGIAGIIHYDTSRKVNENQLTICRDTLMHRGPDFGANYIDGNVGLAHRRLSIIDLSEKANQPMISADSNFSIVFNGEIYNFLELKKELLAKGVSFYSNSDTEVLLNMYIYYGRQMLSRLDGMFAFAIWDKQKRELFIARDRVGIKPLYFAETDNSFVFASEEKALFKAYLPVEVDEGNLCELLLYRYVAGASTLFKHVNKLLPGHYLIVNSEGIKENIRWWNLKTAIQNHAPINQPEEWFANTFNSAVKSHMVSDVPVGVLLSGGLDSGSICASLNAQKFQNIQTFNVGFSNFKDDETLLAKEVAQKFNYPFNSLLVENETLLENTKLAVETFGDTLIHQNEPQLIAISKFANTHVKVLLSGEGADELMGGYVRYRALNFFAQSELIKKGLKFIPELLKSKRTQKLERYLSLNNMNEAILLNAANTFPAELAKIGMNVSDLNNDYRNSILAEAKELYPKSVVRQTMYLDQHTYLTTLNDRNDKTTMAASIECRVPFLDHRLVEGLGTLPDRYLLRGSRGKHLLKETFKHSLPANIIRFRKVGFSVPWMKHIEQSEEFMQHWNTMEQSEIMQMGVLKLIDISSLKKKYKSGDASQELLLRQLFFTSLWHKHFIKNISMNT